MIQTVRAHELLQLYLISLQRSGQNQRLADVGPKILAATSGDEWINTLVKVTLGVADLAQVRDQIRDEERACQFAYYNGARLLTVGNREAGRAALAAARDGSADCLERRLAGVELGLFEPAMPSPGYLNPGQRINLLNEQITQLYQSGRYDQAIGPATEMRDLVRKLGAKDTPRMPIP